MILKIEWRNNQEQPENNGTRRQNIEEANFFFEENRFHKRDEYGECWECEQAHGNSGNLNWVKERDPMNGQYHPEQNKNEKIPARLYTKWYFEDGEYYAQRKGGKKGPSKYNDQRWQR